MEKKRLTEIVSNVAGEVNSCKVSVGTIILVNS